MKRGISKIWLALVVSAVLLLASASTSFATTASFQGLGDLPGGIFRSYAYSVSSDGSVVVGISTSDPDWGYEPFRWENGTMTGLGYLPGGSFAGYARGVSADGSVVVGGSRSASGYEAFRWEDGVMTGLGYLPFYNEAYGVSVDGSVVVGRSHSDSGLEAFRWEDGVMTGLGYLPGGSFESEAYGVSVDGSVVVGRSHSDSGMEAFRWEDGVMTGLGDLPGGSFFSAAYGVSADGSVVVGMGKSASRNEAFRWENGVMTSLGNLPGGSFESKAFGVSADGLVVVGSCYTNGVAKKAFIWNTHDGMLSVQDLLVKDYGLDCTGWMLRGAWGISANALTIVGFGTNPDGYTEGWIATLPGPATTYYVDALNGDDDNDGLSKETAFATIQKAIDTAFNGDTVLVADGTYTGHGNRDIDFLGKAITVKSKSGPENCIIDCQGTEANPHRGFYFQNGEGKNSILDGFTITGGYMDTFLSDKIGGGILCNGSSPTITNCTFTGNSAWWDGGGIHCDNSSLMVINCTFSGNIAGDDGGGMFNYNSSPTVINCTFSGNSADYGGGMFNKYSSPTVINCTFSGNGVYFGGGGMSNQLSSSPTVTNCTFSGNYTTSSSFGHGVGMFNYNNSSPTITNCTFTGNSGADYGGGMWNGNSNPTVSNCILWGNTAPTGAQIYNDSVSSATVSYSDIESCVGSGAGWDPTCGIDGGNNIDADPYFVDVAGGDLHLQFNSPCIDAGDNWAVPPDTTDLDSDGNTTEPIPWDLDGNPRVIGDAIDMGAYETNYIEAQMKFTPQMLNCNSRGNWVKAHLTLPEEFLPQDVDVNEPAVAEPMSIESEYIKVLGTGTGTGPVKLEVVFDRETFCAQITETGEVEITVIGSLTTGRYFYGSDTIKIKP